MDLPVQVTSTIARASYGVTYYTTFDSSKHLDHDKSWHKKECKWVANNQMKWFVKVVCWFLSRDKPQHPNCVAVLTHHT